MSRDRLLLLKADFMDQDQGPGYCPACATLEGLLGFYPELRESLDVVYLDFPRPREAVIAEQVRGFRAAAAPYRPRRPRPVRRAAASR